MSTVERILKLPAKAIAVVFGVFAITTGSMLIIPIYASYLKNDLGFSLEFVGIIMTIKLVSQWGLSIVGGLLSDRYGAKRLLVSGLFIRAMAFLCLAYFTGPVPIIIGTLLLGLGSSLFIPASKSMLVWLTKENQRLRAFSYRDIAVNFGTAVGPLIGLILPFNNFSGVSFSLAFVFVGLGFAFALFNFTSGEAAFASRSREFSWSVFWKPYVLSLMGAMTAFFVFYSQLEFSMPVFSSSLDAKNGPFAVFLVNSVIVIVFQALLIRFLETNSTRKVLLLGFSCFGLAFLSMIAIPNSVTGLIVCAVLFSFAEILVAPKIESELSNAVPVRLSGTTMGVMGVAQGVGATLGNYMGAHLSFTSGYFLFGNEVSALWLILGVVAFGVSGFSFLLLTNLRGASNRVESALHPQ